MTLRPSGWALGVLALLLALSAASCYNPLIRSALDSQNDVRITFDILINDEVQALSDYLCAGTSSGREKMLAINRWMVLHIEYDRDTADNVDVKRQDSISVLHSVPEPYTDKPEKEGLAVCQGYACLTAALARAAGIEARYVSSAAMNHAWNAVFIEGKWLQLDTTWNDSEFPEGGPDISKSNWDEDDYRNTDFAKYFFLLETLPEHYGGFPCDYF